MEMYIRALNDDAGNFPMQQTSSMAFLDHTLREGAYAPGGSRELVYDPNANANRSMLLSGLHREYVMTSRSCLNRANQLASLGADMGQIFDAARVEHPIFLSSEEQRQLPPGLDPFLRIGDRRTETSF